MITVILVIHLMIAAALVGVVLIQRSEGGALGIGGGGGGFMSGRGTANVLTRATAILAAGFFATSIILTILANQSPAGRSILDKLNKAPASSSSQPVDQSTPGVADGAAPKPSQPADAGGAGGGILDKLKVPAPQ